MTTEPITDRNQETLDLIAEAVHRISHQVDEMHREWQRLRPMVEGWQRGGLLGMRAARRGNGG